jgi:hypothetical protein
VQVESGAIVAIALVPGAFYGVIKALASGVVSPNNGFLVDRLGQLTSVKESECSDWS